MMCVVDRHDQTRLQSHSLQTSFRFKKYYKGLFLGLLDLAVVDAYVAHVECAKRSDRATPSRVELKTELHAQHTAVEQSDFTRGGDDLTPTRRLPGPRIRHTIALNDEWRDEGKDKAPAQHL